MVVPYLRSHRDNRRGADRRSHEAERHVDEIGAAERLDGRAEGSTIRRELVVLENDGADLGRERGQAAPLEVRESEALRGREIVEGIVAPDAEVVKGRGDEHRLPYATRRRVSSSSPVSYTTSPSPRDS
jgi:hypothetical protein